MITYVTHWTFIIGMDASRSLSWQQVAPHVAKHFPRIFGTKGSGGDATVKTKTGHVARPTCEITWESSTDSPVDEQHKLAVKVELAQMFIPAVFGPRAELLDMHVTSKRRFRMAAEPAATSATPGRLGPC